MAYGTAVVSSIPFPPLMRRIERRDGPLAIALIVGAFVMFHQPLRFALVIAEDVSERYHIDLVPGLMIFVLVFTVHHWRKHRDASIEAELAVRDADEARRTIGDMERLIAASRAVAAAIDSSKLRTEAWRHVPPLVGNRPVWMAVRAPLDWQWIVEPIGGDVEAMLERVPELLKHAEAGEGVHDGLVLFPLRGSGPSFGLLAVTDSPPLTILERKQVEALAALLGIAVQNVHLFEEMQVTSASDSLTGCFNRAHAFATLDNELRRARRTRRPLSIIMLDIDGFKAINDEHGHLCGDRLLEGVGETLRRTLRMSDVKCRYGGDEFLVILPETPLEGAEQVGEHLRRAVEQLTIPGSGGPFSCRVSVGVATAAGEMDPNALVHRADQALYSDKARHQLVLVAGAPATPESAPAAREERVAGPIPLKSGRS
jgi:diguanylate cyclase (GGDEF)-like protein